MRNLRMPQSESTERLLRVVMACSQTIPTPLGSAQGVSPLTQREGISDAMMPDQHLNGKLAPAGARAQFVPILCQFLLVIERIPKK